ncbi:MAG: RNA polymerase sigma factor [Deltaproteobacteria bacterium]|nr:RNA polymerase sigma factor [Deltaproteobacteria bacterium]
MSDAASPIRRAIAAVWRIESPRILGGLVRMVHDVGLAEDLAQATLLTALERWPSTGVPDNPGAWLMATAKRRAIDHRRHEHMVARRSAMIADDALDDAAQSSALEAALDTDVDDDVLRLMFVACHPLLATQARTALTLRLLGGLTTEEIARAFLVPTPTVAQRIVRAKRTLAEARVPLQVPHAAERAERLPSVYEVLYLIFNEGYAASRGDDWIRVELCDEALRLGRILAALVPEQPEAHGLLALMELHASRLRTRVDAHGDPILLLDQDRARWDHLLIQRGLAALDRAEALARPLGPYTLQAAIVACHARARTADATDWPRIVALYDALVELTQSPVVALNRAVAVGMAFGAHEGLAAVDALADEPALQGYHHLPAARADLLVKLGQLAQARGEFERAAGLTQHDRERALLLRRAKDCALPPRTPD